jgi:uncharacterized membrane protein YvbJ
MNCCDNCGANVPDGAIFCHICGVRFPEDNADLDRMPQEFRAGLEREKLDLAVLTGQEKTYLKYANVSTIVDVGEIKLGLGLNELSQLLELFVNKIQRNRSFQAAIPRTLSSSEPRDFVEVRTIDNIHVGLPHG